MIIEQQKTGSVYISGKVDDSSTDMEIDSENIGLLMNFLSKNIYSDAIGSLIRETVSNCWDATSISGKNIPIIVKLEKNERRNWEFTVEDKALGLDKDDVENIIKKYLKSTKRSDNTQLGGLGLGFKSPLAYKSSFTFIGTKNGWKRTWIIYEGDFGNKIDLINEEETKEENGVKVIVSVNDYDVREFSSKINEQLPYFSNVYIINDYNSYNNENKIYENTLFKWSENQKDSKMHIALGEVYYSLDFKKLGISDIYIPVAIKIGLDEGIIPTLNRESFMLTPQTKDLILSKIKLVSEWFVNKYNEQVKEFDTLLQAWEYINVSEKEVSIEGREFEISELEKFSDVKFLTPKVKGISYIKPERYKTIKDHLVKGYKSIGLIKWNGKVSNTGRYEEGLISEYFEGKKAVVIDSNLTGFFREYVKTLSYKHFVKKVPFNFDLKYYKQILSLKDYPRKDWRNVIKEWQTVKEGFCKELFTDGTKLHLSKDFLEYKEDNKTKTYSTKSYKALNKEKGQITITHFIPNHHRNDYKQEKFVKNVDDLHKNPFLSLIFTSEEAELCKEYTKTFASLTRLRFYVLGKKDYKTVDNLNIKNVKMFAKTQQKDIRCFKKMATAHLFKDIVEKYDTITRNAQGVIKDLFPSLHEARNVLNDYVRRYNTVDGDIAKDIIVKAKETNDFDFLHWKEFKAIEHACSQLDFIRFVEYDYRVASKEEFATFINQMILTRKMMGKLNLENLQICVVEPVKEVVRELETV